MLDKALTGVRSHARIRIHILTARILFILISPDEVAGVPERPVALGLASELAWYATHSTVNHSFMQDAIPSC